MRGGCGNFVGKGGGDVEDAVGVVVGDGRCVAADHGVYACVPCEGYVVSRGLAAVGLELGLNPGVVTFRDGVGDFPVFSEIEMGGGMHPPGAAPELVGSAFAQFAAGWVQLVLCFNNADTMQHGGGAGSAWHAECAYDDEG